MHCGDYFNSEKCKKTRYKRGCFKKLSQPLFFDLNGGKR